MDDTKNKKTADVQQTLHDDDIVTGEPEAVGRRSAVARIGFSFLGAVGAAIGLRPATAEAQNCTDSDGGPYADQPGYGRRCRVYYRQPVVYVAPQPQPQGCTDADGGPYADGGGRGRRCGGGPVYYGGRGRRRSCTDSDSGSYADAAGRGRGC